VLKIVSPAIDGPNVALVIRFEHEGQERFARWIGEKDWREPASLERLFETTDPPSGRLRRRLSRCGSSWSRRWDPRSSRTSSLGRSVHGTVRR